jgi:hypothetical protein
MADWTADPISPLLKPPGAINPPAPDKIQPTDPGWAPWVRQETDATGLNWTPNCSVSLEVTSTGITLMNPIDGDNPTDYAADKDWGWKEDRNYETTPPEPYQDFTRWVRHYPNVNRQKYVRYRAQVYVRCGTTFVARPPVYFWSAEGPIISGPLDTYQWTKTSGMETGPDGKTYKWQKTGKKDPPPWQRAKPFIDDLNHPEPNTPPPYLVHPLPPIDYGLGPHEYGVDAFGGKFRRYGWRFSPGDKPYNWIPLKDVPDKDPAKKGK